MTDGIAVKVPLSCARAASIGVAWTAGALCASLASAQTTTPPAAAVARADLAAAYLRIDKAYAAATLTDSARAAINRQFDRSTLSFFVGRFANAIAAIDSATVAISGASISTPPAPAPRLVNGKAPSIARDAFLQRLAKLDSVGPLAQAFISVSARVQLLVDTPSRERSAEFLNDPVRLARDLTREVSVLERGRDPYVGQSGDLWRVMGGANGARIPFRMVAPSAAATSTAPLGVLIALHGAGGDENMFIDAYGQGILARMALDANLIVVSPLANTFGLAPEHFDSLMTLLHSEYRIDDHRIFVLGHSMGAGMAARLAQVRPTQVAAAACLSGGAAVNVPNAPPVLFIGAALDPIIPARVVQAAASGTPTGTYRQLENEGHTLGVANGVRIAIPWLLARRP